MQAIPLLRRVPSNYLPPSPVILPLLLSKNYRIPPTYHSASNHHQLHTNTPSLHLIHPCLPQENYGARSRRSRYGNAGSRCCKLCAVRTEVGWRLASVHSFDGRKLQQYVMKGDGDGRQGTVPIRPETLSVGSLLTIAQSQHLIDQDPRSTTL